MIQDFRDTSPDISLQAFDVLLVMLYFERFDGSAESVKLSRVRCTFFTTCESMTRCLTKQFFSRRITF